MQKLWSNQARCRERQQGFSLFELLVVIAIAAVIAGIATPGFLSMRERYKLRAAATDVMSAIKKVQTEAVMRKSSVAIDLGTGSYTCFVDDGAGVVANAKNMIKDAGETVISTTILQTEISLSNNNFPVVNGKQNIEFNSAGMPAIVGGVQKSVGTIDITRGASFTTQYRIEIYPTGHVGLHVSTNSGASWN